MKSSPPYVPARRAAALALLSALSLIGQAEAESLNLSRTLTVDEMRSAGTVLDLRRLNSSAEYEYDSVSLDLSLPSIRTFGSTSSAVGQINVLYVPGATVSLTAPGGMTFAIT
jgi:hypothetical protein